MSRASLADLTAFAAVARHRSFRQAADALGVSRSTLSHTVIGLERNLGVRLLNRTTRSVSTTEAGERLLQRLEPLLGELDEVIDTAAGDGGAVGRQAAHQWWARGCGTVAANRGSAVHRALSGS